MAGGAAAAHAWGPWGLLPAPRLPAAHARRRAAPQQGHATHCRDVLDGSNELRIMLCKDKLVPTGTGSKRGTSVIAACGEAAGALPAPSAALPQPSPLLGSSCNDATTRTTGSSGWQPGVAACCRPCRAHLPACRLG